MELDGAWLSLFRLSLVAGAIAAILSCIVLVRDKVVIPWWRGILTVNKRWDDAGEIEAIKSAVEGLVQAISPSNGDQRSISDRVDTAKHNAIEANAKATHAEEAVAAVRQELIDYREHDELRREEGQRKRDRYDELMMDRVRGMEDLLKTTLAKLEAGNPEIRKDVDNG